MKTPEFSAAPADRLSWSGVREIMLRHPLRRSEIPVEHVVSLPLPTKRYGAPAFAFYAGAVVRVAAEPPRSMPPDRHWAIGASDRMLLIYARTTAVALAPHRETWTAVEMQNVAGGMKAAQERLAALAPIMDQASAAFFDGVPARFGAELRDEIRQLVGDSTLPFYRALAPDFWAWLDGSEPDAEEGRQS